MNEKRELFGSLKYDESLAYTGWAEYLPLKVRRVKLFDHEIIEIGRTVKAKWKGIVNGKHKDGGRHDCAYCLKYYNNEDFTKRCSGCPIEYFTKGPECIATPYLSFRCSLVTSHGLPFNARCGAKKMQQFVDEIFIRSLLLIDWRKYYEMPSVQG